jgi:hypothetical protein
MEDSILISTKKILGLPSDYTPFDLDILTHINSTLSILDQLDAGPADHAIVEDETVGWNDIGIDPMQISMVRAYTFLKVRMLFDPPATSYLIEAMNKQIGEFEWRLHISKEIEQL